MICHHRLALSADNPAECVLCRKKKGHTGLHTSGLHPGLGYEWNDAGEQFDWRKAQKGNAFPCDWDDGEEAREEMVLAAILDAKKQLPAGTVFEIRGKMPPPKDPDQITYFDYGREPATRRKVAQEWGVAWYTITGAPPGFEHLETPKTPLFLAGTEGTRFSLVDGYMLIGRLPA